MTNEKTLVWRCSGFVQTEASTGLGATILFVTTFPLWYNKRDGLWLCPEWHLKISFTLDGQMRPCTLLMHFSCTKTSLHPSVTWYQTSNVSHFCWLGITASTFHNPHDKLMCWKYLDCFYFITHELRLPVNACGWLNEAKDSSYTKSSLTVATVTVSWLRVCTLKWLYER